MGKTREKKVLLNNVTRALAEEAFAKYATADAQQQRITSKMDVAITKIREQYAGDLDELKESKEEAFELMLNYAENNRVDFGNKKSMEMAHGVLGFRTGTPKLRLKKGFTWPSVTNMLKEFMPNYLRVSEEPAKDRILFDREDPSVANMMDKVGIVVDQDETFFVEPKKEEVSI